MAFEEWSQCREETQMMLNKVLKMEGTPLFTQNHDLLEAEEKRWYSCYQHERLGYESIPEQSVPVPQKRNALPVPPLIYNFPTPRSLHEEDISRTWSTNDEVRVMANVQAYFQVAYKVNPHVRTET